MRTEIRYSGTLVVSPEYPGEQVDREAVIEQAFTDTMSELVALGAEDPSVTGSVATGTLEVSVLVEADGPVDAFRRADPMIRSALHAAGVSTADWTRDEHRILDVEFRRYEAEDVPVDG